MRLKDKISIITGGASGIGKATVIRFAEEGAKVVFCCRSKDKGEALMDELKEADLAQNVRYFPCDVSKEEDVISLAKYTKDEFGNCEILFNNAGVHQAGKLHETKAKDWDRIMNIDLRGVYLMCYQILPQMIENH